MYAVIKTGGKQYRVQKGDVVRLEKLDTEVGKKITLDQVMLVRKGENITVGLDAAKVRVSAVVTEQDKGKKVIVFKKHRRKNYVRTMGHRQCYTAVRITGIRFPRASAEKQATEKE